VIEKRKWYVVVSRIFGGLFVIRSDDEEFFVYEDFIRGGPYNNKTEANYGMKKIISNRKTQKKKEAIKITKLGESK
jgi:hypothetical protein